VSRARACGVAAALIAAGLAAACVPIAVPRFPADVSAALAEEPTRRLETDQVILYYPASRVAEARRFVAHAERCLEVLRASAVVRNRFWAAKPVIVMPELAYNNAYVAAPTLGLEPLAVIPTFNTLDFATEFGLPPDPGFIGCHELVHQVQDAQIDGTWAALSTVFGAVVTPQVGFDAWFFEGVATHYEASLQPGVGRPRWPIFTGMFAAGYAGRSISGGDLSELGRRAPVGHHYLVGTMFVDFLVERYGERALWLVIANQASSALLVTSVAGRFEAAYGRSLGTLIDEFSRWSATRFPVRAAPATQTRVRERLGADARYARGLDGTEAWIAGDVDRPVRLVVRAPDGRVVADEDLTELVPPRTLATADPLAVSGLSITADGREVWLTAVDLAGTSSTTRLLRWRQGDGLVELATGLGPGGTIAPDGATYYYVDVDGDRWRLARWDVAGRRRAGIVGHVTPGTYVLAAQPSADGARLIESVWDGVAFALWIVDAATGERLETIVDPAGGPVYDGAFLADGRAIFLGVVDGRFQVRVRADDGSVAVATDAAYAVLAPRGGPGGTIRFLDRERWQWDLAEIQVAASAGATAGTTAPSGPVSAPALPSSASPTPTPTAPPVIRSDVAYSRLDRLFVPTLRAPSVVTLGPGLPLFGLVLAGGDRLGFQRWAGAAYVQPGIEGQRTVGSGAISYVNAMLAPWLVFADGSIYRWNQREADDDPATDLFVYRARRTRDASLAIARVWRESIAASLSASFTDDHDQLAGTNAIRSRLAGATAALAYDAIDPTLYTGAGRALAASASVGYFPASLSTFAGDLVDLAAAIRVAAPVPPTHRLMATAEGRGRAVIARAAVDADLIEVGGAFAYLPLWGRSSVDHPDPIDDLRFPPGRRFGELVRGFEDLPISTDRAALGDLGLRYPLVIDRGIASTWFLPATFVRQLDLEVFGAGWLDLDPDRPRQRHLAVGGAVTLRIALFRLPLAIQYQVARRITDDDAVVQLVGVGPDL